MAVLSGRWDVKVLPAVGGVAVDVVARGSGVSAALWVVLSDGCVVRAQRSWSPLDAAPAIAQAAAEVVRLASRGS